VAVSYKRGTPVCTPTEAGTLLRQFLNGSNKFTLRLHVQRALLPQEGFRYGEYTINNFPNPDLFERSRLQVVVLGCGVDF